MNAKQRSFVAEYIKDKNATQAAIRAGYSEKTAKQIGSRLLTNVDVQAEVAEKTKRIEERCEITAVYVLSGIKEVAERCMQRKPVMVRDGKGWKQKTETVEDPKTGEEREEGVWEFNAMGANKSFELLGKSIALWTDKVQHALSPELIEMVVKMFTEAAMGAALESCPHCKTRLDMPEKIAAELLKVSEKIMTVAVPA